MAIPPTLSPRFGVLFDLKSLRKANHGHSSHCSGGVIGTFEVERGDKACLAAGFGVGSKVEMILYKEMPTGDWLVRWQNLTQPRNLDKTQPGAFYKALGSLVAETPGERFQGALDSVRGKGEALPPIKADRPGDGWTLKHAFLRGLGRTASFELELDKGFVQGKAALLPPGFPNEQAERLAAFHAPPSPGRSFRQAIEGHGELGTAKGWALDMDLLGRVADALDIQRQRLRALYDGLIGDPRVLADKRTAAWRKGFKSRACEGYTFGSMTSKFWLERWKAEAPKEVSKEGADGKRTV